LTLLGLPLTLGFAARWALLSQLEAIPAGLLLLATLGGLWGLVRKLLPQ
jgi:formate hydrogenlyase subunit 3/multisubunit Na+/H+ antiporter MnhD subunit